MVEKSSKRPGVGHAFICAARHRGRTLGINGKRHCAGSFCSASRNSAGVWKRSRASRWTALIRNLATASSMSGLSSRGSRAFWLTMPAALPATAAFPGQIAGEGFVGRHAQGEHVDAVVGGQPLDEFGGEVVGGAGAVARLAELRLVGNGQAEIDELDDALLGDHDVARADVAVQIAGLVHVFEGVGQLARVDRRVAFELRAAWFRSGS